MQTTQPVGVPRFDYVGPTSDARADVDKLMAEVGTFNKANAGKIPAISDKRQEDSLAAILPGDHTKIEGHEGSLGLPQGVFMPSSFM